ncbi:MAG: hypothetical protein ACOVQA_03305, partial [Thermoflexibacteraceae bacterium]
SYLGVVHTIKGKAIEITTKGNYQVKDLISQTLQGKESNLKLKYFNFIINEMTKENKDAQPRSRYMNKTGAVERDIAGMDWISIKPNESGRAIDIYGNEIGVGWIISPDLEKHNKGEIAQYAILVMDLAEQVYYTIYTKGKEQDIVLEIPNKAFAEAGTDLMLRVVPIFKQDKRRNEVPKTEELLNAKEYGVIAIEELGMQRSQKINEDLKELCSSSDDEMNLLLKAEYFKENKLLLNAMAAYLKLINTNPNEPQYKLFYDRLFVEDKKVEEPKK